MPVVEAGPARQAASWRGALAAISPPKTGAAPGVYRRHRFCPSCMGRRMSATAGNLIERVLPPSTALRQWVLTFPFSWRPRLAQDGELLGQLTQIFVDMVQAFYTRRAAREGAPGAKTGAITHLPQLPGADETTRGGEEPCRHCPLPGRGGRAHRCAAARTTTEASAKPGPRATRQRSKRTEVPNSAAVA